VLEKDEGFYVHQIGGEARDIFLAGGSAQSRVRLIMLQFMKSGRFYASANFQKHPFDKACYLIVADDTVNLRSRSFLNMPELCGRINSRIYFYAKDGLMDYVSFYIKLNTPLL
jgi:hypothetical protein